MSEIIPAGQKMNLTTEDTSTFDAYLEAAQKAHPEMDLAKRVDADPILTTCAD